MFNKYQHELDKFVELDLELGNEIHVSEFSIVVNQYCGQWRIWNC